MVRALLLLFVASMVTACMPQQSVKKQNQYLPVTETHLKLTKTAEMLGRSIHQKDEMAKNATDYLLEEGILPKDKRIRGWVVDYENSAVHFMGMNREPEIIYSVLQSDSGEWSHKASSNASVRVKRMFAARQVALKNIQNPCSNRYNTVVLPNGDNWLVYALAASTEPSLIMAGGHKRFNVSADGSEVLKQEHLSRSCVKLPSKPDSVPFITHIIDEVPIEIHSYISLAHSTDMYVGTKTGVWHITNGKLNHIAQ